MIIQRVERKIKKIIIKKRIIHYCKKDGSEHAKEIVEWIKNGNDLTYFNYSWFHDLEQMPKYTIEADEEGRYYILYHNHRMFFKEKWGRNEIEVYLNNLLPEQDKRSPHLYFADGERKKSYGVVVDAGAAEGFFALDIIDISEKVYLIEPDPEWAEALKRTFADYKDKVVLLEQFIGGDSDQSCSLKKIINDNGRIDIVKLDVEGAEIDALNGIGNGNLGKIGEMIICVYHYQNEEKDVLDYLSKQEGTNIKTMIRDGYIFFLHDKKQTYPYLRHGVLKVKIQNEQ